MARAALYIAGEDAAKVDVERSLEVLDKLAEDVGLAMESSIGPATAVEKLSLVLGVKKGFKGDSNDYYNPSNAFLDQALERKKGLPIILSLVYMEVGSRLGMEFEAVGLPGHLVIRLRDRGPEVYLDPFNRGRLMTRDDCMEQIGRMYGGRVELVDEHFEPYSKKQFLIRLLANLKNIYIRLKDYPKAIAAADRVALIDPHMGSNLKERAWMFNRVRQYRRAIEDLETYLRLEPDAKDARRVRGQVRTLWKTIATLN